MIKKIFITILILIIAVNTVNAIDTSNWSEVTVGYENFSIPPNYSNPYQSNFNMYQYGEDIDEFTIRFVNPNIMDLYGYFLQQNSFCKKVEVSGHDAVHFVGYDRQDNTNNSKLWFSAGEEFYYIAWRGENITPTIKEIVKSSSKSKYTHDEFYSILNDEFQNYKIVNSIESQKYDYPTQKRDTHSFVSFGSNGINFGLMR